MHSPMKALTAAALAAGVVMSGAAPRTVTTPHVLAVSSAAALQAAFVPEADVTVTSLHWTQLALGVGLGSQTITLRVNGVDACTLTVTCLAAVGTEVVVSCDQAISSGADVEWGRSGCTTAAAGTLIYGLRQ